MRRHRALTLALASATLAACGTTSQSAQPTAKVTPSEPHNQYLAMYAPFSTATPYDPKFVTVPDQLRILAPSELSSEIKDTKNPYVGSVYVGTGNSPTTRMEIYTAEMFGASRNWYASPQFLNSPTVLHQIATLLAPFDAYTNESQSWLSTNPHAISVFGGENAQEIGYNPWPSTLELLHHKSYIIGAPATTTAKSAIGSVPVTFCTVLTGLAYPSSKSVVHIPPTEVQDTIYVAPQVNKFDQVWPITGYYNTPGAKC